MKNIHHFLPIVLIAIFGLLSSIKGLSQCSASNSRPPASVTETNLSGSDFDWDDANDVLTANNNYAYAGTTLTLLNPSKYSNYMSLSNFNMAIPSAVTICGIVVQMDRKATGLSLGAQVKDYRVRLVKGGSIIGDNKASASGWTGTLTTATYGSSSDLWGTTWTPTDINSGNFGFAFSAEISGLLGVFLSADIDNVRIIVYYQHIVLPVSIKGFQGTQKGSIVELNWETTNGRNINKFIVERQLNPSTWEPIQEIETLKYEQSKNTFRAYDLQPKANNVYRLKLVEEDNAISYSNVTNVKIEHTLSNLLIIVNNNNKTLQVTADDPITFCRIFKTNGEFISVIQNPLQKNQLIIPMNSMPRGNILLQAETKKKSFSKIIHLQ